MENIELTRAQLHGFSREDAECFGKPHLGAQYTGPDSLTKYARTGQHCIVCGRTPISTHHQPYRQTFTLVAANGVEWKLRPALFAVCGTGTTGCHGAIEHNRVKIRWEWDSLEAAAKWWSGELLEAYGPHSVQLYKFGCWAITREDGTVFRLRPTPRAEKARRGSK